MNDTKKENGQGRSGRSFLGRSAGIAGLLALGCWGGFLVPGSRDARTVRAEEFLLLGPDGKVIGRWGHRPGAGDARAPCSSSSPVLTLFGDGGKPVVRLGADSSGGLLEVFDAAGVLRCRLELDPRKYGIDLRDEKGRSVVRLGNRDGDGPGLGLEEGDSDVAAELRIVGGEGFLALGTGESRRGISLFLKKDALGLGMVDRKAGIQSWTLVDSGGAFSDSFRGDASPRWTPDQAKRFRWMLNAGRKPGRPLGPAFSLGVTRSGPFLRAWDGAGQPTSMEK